MKDVTSRKKSLPRHGQKRKSRHKTFVPSGMINTLFPSPEEKEVTRKFRDSIENNLRSLLKESYISIHEEHLNNVTAEIVHCFWDRRRYAHRLTVPEIKKSIKPIKKALENLFTALDHPTFIEFGGYNSLYSSYEYYRRRNSHESYNPSITELINNLKIIHNLLEKTYAKTARPGAPSKFYIRELVDDLASLWEHISGAKVTTDGEKKNDEFINLGSEFVSRVVKSLDPEVSINEVRTALKARVR